MGVSCLFILHHSHCHLSHQDLHPVSRTFVFSGDDTGSDDGDVERNKMLEEITIYPTTEIAEDVEILPSQQ